jgi:hypothetical protein
LTRYSVVYELPAVPCEPPITSCRFAVPHVATPVADAGGPAAWVEGADAEWVGGADELCAVGGATDDGETFGVLGVETVVDDAGGTTT